MKLISWNVNGLRACVTKGFLDYFREADADVFCIQESKLQEGQISLELEGYHQYWNYAEKKGYSGTAIFSKKEPLSVSRGLGIEEHDHEGRVIALEYEDFYLVTVYTPNSQDGLARLDYRMAWEDDFRKYLKALEEKKPVVVCGDMNVAHQEIDLKNPKTNRKNAGIYRSGKGKIHEPAGGRLYRYVSLALSGEGGILLVVLPVPGQGEERRMADRLFSGIRQPERPGEGRLHPHVGHGFRSLSRGAGSGIMVVFLLQSVI